MWSGFSPHMLFNRICLHAVVCVSWQQQQRKSTLGFRGAAFACLCMPFIFIFIFYFVTNHHQSIAPLHSHEQSVGQNSLTNLLALMRTLCRCASLFLSVISIFSFSPHTRPSLWLSFLISFQRVSGGQVIHIFCFHFPPDTSTIGTQATWCTSHWAHPTHQLCR